MNRLEFLSSLREGLTWLPKDEVDERVAFYSEMIDDRIEEGLSEEEAILEMGGVDSVISQIVAEIPITKIVKERIKPKRRLGAWEIVLIALGSPIWVSLLAAGFAVLASIYAALWSVLISLWAAFVSIAASAVGCIAGGVVMLALQNTTAGLVAIGTGIFLGGLAIFTFFGCKWASKATCFLTKKLAIGVKNMFVRREKVK